MTAKEINGGYPQMSDCACLGARRYRMRLVELCEGQLVIRSARHALRRLATARYWLSRVPRNTIRVPFHGIRIQLAWPNTAKDHELFLQITDTAYGSIPPRATCLLFLETPTAGPRGDYCRSRPHTRGGRRMLSSGSGRWRIEFFSVVLRL